MSALIDGTIGAVEFSEHELSFFAADQGAPMLPINEIYFPLPFTLPIVKIPLSRAQRIRNGLKIAGAVVGAVASLGTGAVAAGAAAGTSKCDAVPMLLLPAHCSREGRAL